MVQAKTTLSEMPDLVSRTDRYFIHRSLAKPPDYEEAYWNVITDPDGNVRDRLAERERFLANLAHEVEFLRGLRPGRILDIGCGLGFLLSALDTRWERHGVELSSFAAKHASQWGQIFVGDVTAAKYPDGWFDVVVMHHVIEHIEEPAATIREVHRIVKPGGRLVLGTPDFDSGCARRFGERYRLLADPTHVSLFSSESMHRFLRDYGFVIEKVDYPFFDTPYFSAENLQRLFDTSIISPPFYGNFMTFYCRKPDSGAGYFILRDLARTAAAMADHFGAQLEQAAELLAKAPPHVWTDDACRGMAGVFLAGPDAVMTDGTLLAIAGSASQSLQSELAAARRRHCKTVVLSTLEPAEICEADIWITVEGDDEATKRRMLLVLVACLSDRVSAKLRQVKTMTVQRLA